MLATIFGLRHTLTTPVGDNAIRGVSGGEKKRVSIAEALASRACVGAWDTPRSSHVSIDVLVAVLHVVSMPALL